MSEVANELIFRLSSLGVATGEGHRSAVHVHLAVSNLVEPGPGEDSVSGWKTSWDGEMEGIWNDLASTVTVVTGDANHRAATLDGVDDLPDTVLVWLGIVSNGDLAGATSMDCAAYKVEGLRRSQRHWIAGTFSVVFTSRLLARKIGAIAQEWAVVEI